MLWSLDARSEGQSGRSPVNAEENGLPVPTLEKGIERREKNTAWQFSVLA